MFKKVVKCFEKLEFFSGNTIITTLKNSTFGLFHSTIKDLDIPTDNFKLPTIVIIGNESSGKSSLIQNILKCQIFPIDKRRCTKMPIKLELIKSEKEKYLIIFKENIISIDKKENILVEIEKIMKDLDNIIEDELNIKFYHPDVINNTFYDLPGIIEYPENLRNKSKAITNKYINQPNTLIICVVPASTTRLTSNQALGMVIDSQKCENCIIALSMVDLLHDDDIEELFIKRILKKNDELQNINVYKTIGIINKLNTKENEYEWFNNNILNYIDVNIKKDIIEHITLNQLLLSLDNLYHNYIRDNWKNQGIIEIEKNISKLELEYKELGKEELNIDEIYIYIKQNINFKDIFIKLENKNNINPNISNFNINYDKCEESINIYKKNFELRKKNLKINIIEQINNIFNNDNLYKLFRFSSLKDYLINNYKLIINENLKHIDKWFYSEVDKLKYNLLDLDSFYTISNLLNINEKRYILKELELFNINNKNIKLVENKDYIHKRKNIKQQIFKYKKSKEIISKIEHYLINSIDKHSGGII
jgi:hypothetical protein